VLDVGCGRGDFLDYCIARNLAPADYVGIEAVGELADAADAKRLANATIARADFVHNPASMFVAADVVVASGSLNTLDDNTFYATIHRMADATAGAVVFNFLASPRLAAAEYLYWRSPADVLRCARTLAAEVRLLDDYLDGDATIAMVVR
jgi:trans-aconitate methyltransferase